jgi:hypothetical protein
MNRMINIGDRAMKMARARELERKQFQNDRADLQKISQTGLRNMGMIHAL